MYALLIRQMNKTKTRKNSLFNMTPPEGGMIKRCRQLMAKPLKRKNNSELKLNISLVFQGLRVSEFSILEMRCGDAK
ncbi:MAG: hypothetical protein PVG19_07435 [Desulfobacterales bacterium]|jgi:hypothetical protein